MIKRILLVAMLLVALLLGFAAMQPDNFRVERSKLIKASPEKVFSYLNDFQRFGLWSPWEKLDPAMTRTFEGPSTGKGAVYGWSGNDDVGAGRMEILAVEPNTRITIQLDFLKPFESRNTTDYILQANPDGTTQMTWAMHGPMPFVSKLMGVFVSMDTLIGKDFEQGLANLQSAAEK